MKTFKEIYSEDASSEKITLGSVGRHGEVRLVTAAAKETVTIVADGAELTLGGNDFNGDLIMKTAAGDDVVTIHADKAELTLGGTNINGDLIIKGSAGKERVSLHALISDDNEGNIIVSNSYQYDTGILNADTAKLTLGHGDIHFDPLDQTELHGVSGQIILNNKSAQFVPRDIGGGKVVNDLEQVAAISLDGDTANLTMGCAGADGDIILKNNKGNEAVNLNADGSSLTLGSPDYAGSISLKNTAAKKIMSFDGLNGILTIGATGTDGDIALKNNKGNEAINLNADGSSLTLGSPDYSGNVFLKNRSGSQTIFLDGLNAKLTIGGGGANGDISIKNNVDCESIYIDGAAGDITFKNCDVAEEFDVCHGVADNTDPGTVVVLSEDGSVKPCERECDTAVVGIVSGAADYRPALVMHKLDREGRVPVAMMGKVYCKVEAETAAIRTGDLLTTSRLAGHATKAISKTDAIGAIIGKALATLESGVGLIPVLVTLR